MGTNQTSSAQRVLFLSTLDGKYGAPRAAYRLYQALQETGITLQFRVTTKFGDDPSVIALASPIGKLVSRLGPSLDKFPLYLTARSHYQQIAPFWSLNWVPYPTARFVHQFQPDLIHMHWIGGGFIPISQLRHFNRPIIWTLHDEWAYTGGCHYTDGCEHYLTQCGKCPQLGSTRQFDVSKYVWKQKHKYWQDTDLTIITPSHWLADKVRQSPLLGNRRVEVIPNGIDTKRYQPVDKHIARELLGLPPDKKLILFGAVSSTSDTRKGFSYLSAALNTLAETWRDRAELVVFGGKSDVQLQLKTHYIGHLHDDVSLALVYAAADVFVAPSLQDNLPNTIMESLACGTPCVAFKVGGIADMIDHLSSGYLAEPLDASDLKNGIQWVLGNDGRQLSENARHKAISEYAAEHIANKHLELYRDVDLALDTG